MKEKDSHSICFVSPYAYPLLVPSGQGPGGAERQFVLFGDKLSKQGWQVSFITEHPIGEYKTQQPSLPVYTCSFSYMGGSNKTILYDWYSLYRAMKNASSRYYVLKTPGHLLAPMAVFCYLNNRKLIFWGQTSHDAYPQRIENKSFVSFLQNWGVRRADIILAQTKDQAASFSKFFNKKAHHVPSMATTLPSMSVKQHIYNDKEIIDVLWAGNTTKNKRFEVVLYLAKMFPEIRFAVAMNNSDQLLYNKYSSECLSSPNLLFLGQIKPSEMEEIYKNTKILLNTSIREGFPNTFLQAWMHGIPVLSLSIDPDNVIVEKNIGRVVNKKYSKIEKYNFEYLAITLKPYIYELLNDFDLRLKIGKKAKEYIEKSHSPQIALEMLIQAIEN